MLLRLVLSVFGVMVFGAIILSELTRLSLVGLLGKGALVSLVISLAVWSVLSLGSRGLAQVLSASAGGHRPREHSEQQALVVRGAYWEAADSYRAHLIAFPDDQAARLLLAALLERHLADSAGAEALYWQVRASEPTAAQRLVVGNSLIDLYRRRGDRALFRAELSRLARDFAGTPAGEGARRQLRAMVMADEANMD
jgi:hypothetical protein